MESLSKDLLKALHDSNLDHDLNQDCHGDSSFTTMAQSNSGAPRTRDSFEASPRSTRKISRAQKDTSTTSAASLTSLPSEILLSILDYLTVPELVPCQTVSRRLRKIARTTLLDKLGGQCSHRQHCSTCQRLHSGRVRLPFQSGTSLTEMDLARVGGGLSLGQGGGPNGLPPLPHNYHANGGSISSAARSESGILTDSSPHHLSHHLYQYQAQDDPTQTQTDLHIHHHSYNVPRHSVHGQSSSQKAADYVAPGTIALSLFPHHDHSPTGWQHRQVVHFRCTGIDREEEKLLFSPILPECNSITFNTNSWNLPSFGSPLSPNPVLTTPASTTLGGGTGAVATGLDLFDYATGQLRTPRPATRLSAEDVRETQRDLFSVSSHAFSNQFGTPSPPSPSSLASSPATLNSPITHTPTWATVNGNGGDHYSVIGVRHGDWPVERQPAGQWWGGGLHSSMALESMVFMPWSGAQGGPGSVLDHQQRLQGQQTQMENTAPMTRSSSEERELNHPSGSSESSRVEGTKIHKHKLYLSCAKAHPPPEHHHRFFCLHHDQLMTDMAAQHSRSSIGQPMATSRLQIHIPTTAGSRDLAVDYTAKVMEKKRCEFCLSSPCKANLEIMVKFSNLRVSLDWILTGFNPVVSPTP